MKMPRMSEHPGQEVAEVQKHLARSVERLGQRRDELMKSLQQIDRELDVLRPVAVAVFGKQAVQA